MLLLQFTYLFLLMSLGKRKEHTRSLLLCHILDTREPPGKYVLVKHLSVYISVYKKNLPSLQILINLKVVSAGIARKIAGSDLSFRHLEVDFRRYVYNTHARI